MAPLPDHIDTILDMGCGTGTWALAIAKERPDSHITAVDLTPPKLTCPPNLQIVEADLERDWHFDKSFSFIHGRMIMTGIHDWSKLFSKCWHHLEPGGWLELLDICFPYRAQDPNADNATSSFIEWSHIAKNHWVAKGIDYDAPTQRQERLRANGFVNIQEQDLQWPMGTWPESAQGKLIGKLALENGLAFLSTAGVSIISQAPGLALQEAEKLVADARKNLNDDCDSSRLYVTLKIHTAQKPY